MASMKEIREHIASIQSTQKVTNAMYLIASTKMRRAKEDLAKTRPFFDAVSTQIEQIFQHAGEIESPYLYRGNADDLAQPGTYAYLVVTADRGLAGAYNQNVIQETMKRFSGHGVPVEKSFLYDAQSPTLRRAREITAKLLDLFDRGEISKLFIIYTDLGNGVDMDVRTVRLLPLEDEHFVKEETEEKPIRFEPSAEEVLARVVPAYITGFLYSAMVDSFCAEQNARASAMDSANQNEDDMLRELQLEYNHERQGAITSEITEVSAGARSKKNHMKKEAQHAHR